MNEKRENRKAEYQLHAQHDTKRLRYAEELAGGLALVVEPLRPQTPARPVRDVVREWPGK
jgi:hypothetical protein